MKVIGANIRLVYEFNYVSFYKFIIHSYEKQNTLVVSEGRPKPVTTTRMFPKFFGSRRMSFLFTDWSFSERRYLIAKLVNFSEITAINQSEILCAER